MLVSRRHFLQSTTVGGLSLLALQYLPGSSTPSKPTEERYDWRSIINRPDIHWSTVIEEIDENRIPVDEREEYEIALQDLVNLQGGPTAP